MTAAGPSRGRRFPEAAALRLVLSDRIYRAAYPPLAIAVGFAYGIALPGLTLGSVGLVALRFLTPTQAAFAAAIGLLLPLVVLLNLFMWRHPACVRGGSPGRRPTALSGAVLGVLPNMLCCSPVIPTLVALFAAGSSAVAVSAPLQYIFARYEAPFYLVAALLVLLSLRSAARRIDSTRLMPTHALARPTVNLAGTLSPAETISGDSGVGSDGNSPPPEPSVRRFG
jgi:hypothetical protein